MTYEQLYNKLGNQLIPKLQGRIELEVDGTRLPLKLTFDKNIKPYFAVDMGKVMEMQKETEKEVETMEEVPVEKAEASEDILMLTPDIIISSAMDYAVRHGKPQMYTYAEIAAYGESVAEAVNRREIGISVITVLSKQNIDTFLENNNSVYERLTLENGEPAVKVIFGRKLTEIPGDIAEPILEELSDIRNLGPVNYSGTSRRASQFTDQCTVLQRLTRSPMGVYAGSPARF